MISIEIILIKGGVMSQKVRKYADLSLSLLFSLTVVVLAGSFIFSSCAIDDEAVATNTTGDDDGTSGNTVGNTIDNGTTGQDIVVEDFEVSFDENSEYTVVWSNDANRDGIVSSSEWAQPCTIENGTSAWIQCIYDVDELDIWTHGATVNVMLPGDMCSYLGKERYYYANAKVDFAPVYVKYQKSDDSDEVQNVRFFYAGADPDDNSQGVTYAGLNIETEGDIICPWDYTKRHESFKGKNCCKGKYTPYVDNTVGFTGAYEFKDEVEWGGEYINCFKGPGLDDGLALTEDGFPARVVTEVIGQGFGEEYTIKSKLTAFNRGEMVYFANYFRTADHGSNTPAPTRQISGFAGNPYLRFECLDNNDEVIARIDVLIRKWNTTGQIALAASGDPNVGSPGDSPVTESSPFGEKWLDDYFDWADYETAAADSNFDDHYYSIGQSLSACFPSGTTLAPTTCAPLQDY